ncbi:hypothetical protein BO70DRAFT_379192 [Aspergillus heteromorphus CBS 117.55]|uniref:Uncharacterized protein n=1 Tax=Aspergillus heteromorphus CBS 117.55 TaxID=1448321 RepID=A0A317WDB5_9EURO|nr:uncharacterized protein BO70DRAFT_379192 [Aspergillus heteromorphus CBS 117.55]PWY83347.1 hypothetical protein BO70DRAFT_379192 [Aspergillus heteromorphus CBS 117.55]
MFLRSLGVAGVWIASGAALPVHDLGDAARALATTRLTTADSVPGVTGHEVHLPVPGLTYPHDKDPSKAYLAMNVRTEDNALLVNNVSIFPATFPMNLPATRYRDWRGLESETVTLQYAVGIKYLPPHLDGMAAAEEEEEEEEEVYQVELKLFDLSGHPATTDLVVVRLGRADEGMLVLSQILVEPLPRYRDPHGDGNCRWHVKYWRMIGNKYRAWRLRKGHGQARGAALHQNSILLPGGCAKAAASIPIPIPIPAPAGSSRPVRPSEADEQLSRAPVSPFQVFGTEKSSSWSRPALFRAQYHRPDVWRLVVPAIVPALLGATAGLVVCTMGVLVWQMMSCVCGRMVGTGTQSRQGRCGRNPAWSRRGEECVAVVVESEEEEEEEDREKDRLSLV